MRKVDKLVFVTEACKQAFVDAHSEFSDKTIVIENISDETLIRQRSEIEDLTDTNYVNFKNTEVSQRKLKEIKIQSRKKN